MQCCICHSVNTEKNSFTHSDIAMTSIPLANPKIQCDTESKDTILSFSSLLFKHNLYQITAVDILDPKAPHVSQESTNVIAFLELNVFINGCIHSQLESQWTTGEF